MTADNDSIDCDQRREFLAACSSAALCGFAAALAGGEALANTGSAPGSQVRRSYSAALLVDERGSPFNSRLLQLRTNYLFHYPFVATPCLLIDLGRDVGGVGLGRSIVAFSAICSHQLAYPAKEVSFIRFQAKASTHSEAERIHCCADHSVYDPAQGARVVAGPAPAPLAQIELSYDAKTGNLTATGLRGTDQFDAFFRKYDFKLGMEFGGRARDLVGRTSQLQELTRFCRNVAQC
ncbi:MAG TPA: Rieske 2Fe-2S domain-containing protein [Casimicrobium huifangae]|nr:Rieske 2Fe-2S domain-containing protein [Casimicrobium huifangae]HQA33201.1 Rieske 2Fe-2S domain-containing protein [Casimicrobium huifangae]HQD63705.1 Rieske 2Fe-2S domain-containing protein [Casimicrobium huifangae]